MKRTRAIAELRKDASGVGGVFPLLPLLVGAVILVVGVFAVTEGTYGLGLILVGIGLLLFGVGSSVGIGYFGIRVPAPTGPES